MGIKVKAIERNISFKKGSEQWAFVMQAEMYNRLTQDKVVEEASVRSGLPKALLNSAWGAIGDVIVAWATEGHSVDVPGLGTLRFGLNSSAVADVDNVSADLISRRYIIFNASTDIKQQLAKTSVSITCYDRNGNIVKQVTSTDDGDVEDASGSKTDTDSSGSQTSGSQTSGGGSTGEDTDGEGE
jgi:hypothetical protein